MSFSIRLTDDERSLAESYAKLHSMSVGEAIKRAFFEKIEDEYDLAVFDQAKEEFNNSKEEVKPIGELWKELDL